MRAVIFTAAILCTCHATMAADSPEQQAGALAREFVSLLKPQLKQAIAEGGPASAIAVCADLAPAIADALSESSGWDVERVSLKSRNASRAVPDPWQRTVLLDFATRQAAGEDASNMSFGEVVGGQYRYMQAQAVEPLCLVCHGKGLSDEVQDALEQYYPDDTATGYSLGQVRGAISLSRDM
ncbi:MAG: DUF3365 domain-containing protein [Pseudomonadales bacterium]|nr:DUF3365 domain-containing protein [Halioglobus sp.]MCP5129451.1 DUF3365 domain-containing protein [Pseudomonadales bacterium]